MNVYDKGDLVRVSAVFTDTADAAVDPSVVILEYETPAGAVTTLTYGVDAAVVKDAVGSYHADISVTAAGLWNYRWHSTGTGQAAEEGCFTVRRQETI